MINYNKVQDSTKTVVNKVVMSNELIGLKLKMAEQSEQSGVMVLGGAIGSFAGYKSLTSAIIEPITYNLGQTGNTVETAFAMGLTVLTLGGLGYVYTQIPTKTDSKDTVANTLAVMENLPEAPLEENKAEFDRIANMVMDSDHCYISATSGSGKTTFLNYIFDNLLPEKAEYIVLDGKKEGIGKWKNAHTVIDEVAKFPDALERVVGLMHKRQQRPEVQNTLLYVIIDESTLLNDEAIEHASKLLTQARSANIRVFFATQAVSAKLNNLSGLTQLFQGIPTITMFTNENAQRIIQPARVQSGKIKRLGQAVVIPHLPSDWVKDLPFVDDSQDFSFEVNTVPVPIVTNTPENGYKTLKSSNDNGNDNDNVADNNFLMKFMTIATQSTETELDDMALEWVTKISSSIIKRIENNESLSYSGIQATAGMGKNTKKNEDIAKVMEYLEVK